MNDEPKRWLEDGASSFERDLLASADFDRAPRRALSRTLASVQIAAAATLVASTAVGTSASVGTLSVLKWVGFGVVSGLATMVAVETVTPLGPANTEPRDPTRVPVVAPLPEPAPTPPSGKANAPTPPSDSRSPRNSPPVALENAPELPSPATANARRDLARETSLVSEASRKVESGDPTRALALLDQYAREYPNGVLRPEAGVVRVRALVATGRRKEAELLAGSEPNSAHARSMQRALGETSVPKK
jgi:hypothetical protein